MLIGLGSRERIKTATSEYQASSCPELVAFLVAVLGAVT
jgi:hypothetical protein